MVGFLEEFNIGFIIVWDGGRKVIKVSQLLSSSAQTLPVHFGYNSGHEILLELHLHHFHVPGLDEQRVASDDFLHALGGQHVVGEELHGAAERGYLPKLTQTADWC